MDGEALLGLFLEAATLKRLPRSGWLTHGVPHVESVADHSFGVTFMALVLVNVLQDSGGLDEDLDTAKVLSMAILHDLTEVRLTDLPLSAARLLSGPVKSQAEASALAGLLEPLAGAGRLKSVWQEFEDETSPEGRLVRDADKLEMMVQCLRYEQAGSRGLDDFWATTDQRSWHFDLCAGLYAKLRAMRPV